MSSKMLDNKQSKMTKSLKIPLSRFVSETGGKCKGNS